MFGVLGWMRTAVHPDHAIVAPEDTFECESDEPLTHRIRDLVDAHVRPRAAHEVLRRMGLRHVLGERQNRRVPARGFLTRGGVDRKARIVAKLRAGIAVGLVLM